MSMSQEEIESLMNGLDFGNDDTESESTEDEKNEQSNEKMSEDDINELISQTEDIISQDDNKEQEKVLDENDINKLVSENNIDSNSSSESSENNAQVSNDDIDELLELTQESDDAKAEDNSVNEESLDELINSIDNAETEQEPVNESATEEDIDELLNELSQDGNSEEDITEATDNVDEKKIPEQKEEVSSEEDIDDLLASIDGVTDDTKEENSPSSFSNTSIEQNVNNEKDIDDKISKGLFPLPVEDDTKVVNQLSIVANDSEEKATKIFDVLSNILDYNTEIQDDVQALTTFNEKQIAMLERLSTKFPDINLFKQNLEQAQAMNNHVKDINEKLNLGNTEIFQAMELMQYHDINRQKIERVMSVIRKLSTYLNNLFEDGAGHSEVAVAKHIHGDNGTDDLMAEGDLEALIAEFNK